MIDKYVLLIYKQQLFQYSTSHEFKHLCEFEQPVFVFEFSASDFSLARMPLVPDEVAVREHGYNYSTNSKQTGPPVSLEELKLADFHGHEPLESRIELERYAEFKI